MSATDINRQMLEVMHDRSIPALDRGDMLIYKLAEAGLDFRPTVKQLLEEADTGRELKEKAEKEKNNCLVSERFLGTFSFPPTGPRLYAMVTRGATDVSIPVSEEQIQNLRFGDPILVDIKEDRIAGCDGHFPLSGEVVPVESVPDDKPGQVIVRHHDQLLLARLHHDLMESPELCQPGAQVVFDPLRRFVLTNVDPQSKGEELLVDPAKLMNIRRKDVGSPKRVVDEIIERFRQFIDHPEWITNMQARKRCSYLFTGGTGTGKSFTLRLITTEVHDMVEEITGRRDSRVVIVDASQFWSPWFGETESRISNWAKKLENLGSRQLTDRQGRPLQVPLIVVLEECEALLRSRGEMQGSGHLFDRPLALLLQKTESLENALQAPLIWIATTNRADLADVAALRRMGMRQVTFSCLRASEAVSVLKSKVGEIPIRGDSRERLMQKVISYLFGPEPKQAVAEVHLSNSERRFVNRCDLVTPAVLEEAISAGIDRCLRKSHRAGRLLGLDADDVISFLHRHFTTLARNMRSHNLSEYCPDWFAREPVHVTRVVPQISELRSPATTLL
jgi:ATP-dependent 26S proteasome regulatory subunit